MDKIVTKNNKEKSLREIGKNKKFCRPQMGNIYLNIFF